MALDFWRANQRAYQQWFGSPAGREVLKDLAVFCHANKRTVIPGDRDSSLLLAGRQEVWLRIQERLNLTPEQLAAIARGE